MWRGYVVEVLSSGRVWVTIPSRAGSEPVGPLPSVPAGLMAGQEVLVGATDARGQELMVVAAAQDAEPETVTWETITGRPSVFPPEPHTHPWAEVTSKPSTFPPEAHSHPWAEVTGKPSEYPPAAHSHSWGQVTGKPTEFPPEAHRHDWGDVDGAPTTMPPSAHTHPWAEVTGKPAEFPPEAHSHPASQISDATTVGRSVLTAASAAAARTAIGAGTSSLTLGTTASTAKAGNYHPTWAQVTGKPATFPASSHTHSAADVSTGVLDPARLPGATSSTQGAQSPAHWSLLDGATSAATGGAVALRDTAGRVQATDPAADADVATRGWSLGQFGGSGWTWLTLTGSWANFGGSFGSLRARLIMPGVVMLGGVIRPGSLTATFATLPVDMRPTNALLVNVLAWITTTAAYRLNVSPTGALSMTGLDGAPTWVSLDGIVFHTD